MTIEISRQGAIIQSNVMKNAFMITLLIALAGAMFFWSSSSSSDPRKRTEDEHGIKLPLSATEIQSRKNAFSWRTIFDRGVATIFEMNTAELGDFENQLKINSRSAPVIAVGNPMVNGYNVWPKDSPTFVPGNKEYGGFVKTWNHPTTPIEMLSCKSPKGDQLHVEIWKINEAKSLVKLYTDRN